MVDVTTITGGTFHALAGSGTLAVSPDNAEAGDVVSRITVTYTAVTDLANASILITVPAGIMASAATGEAGDPNATTPVDYNADLPSSDDRF